MFLLIPCYWFLSLEIKQKPHAICVRFDQLPLQFNPDASRHHSDAQTHTLISTATSIM